MSNAALSWLLTGSFRDWVDFIAKFRTTFVRELRMSDRWESMTERRQGNTEHIADYFYDKLRLCQALNLSFPEIRDHIDLGIHSQELAVYAIFRYHKSTATWPTYKKVDDCLLCRAQSATVKSSEDKGWKSFPKTRRNTAAPAPTAEVQKTNVVANSTTWARESTTTTVRCFNCNTNGHIARDCPKPRKP